MSVLRICKYGEDVLKQKSKPVEKITPKIAKLISDMLDTMYASFGVGLAANQVGVPLRICVIDVSSRGPKNSFEEALNSKPIILINPRIVGKSGKMEEEEGCLSFPGINIKIKRFKKVKVEAVDGKGLAITVEADGLLSRALQHEIDHIEGKVFLDNLNWLKRRKIEKEIKAVRKQANW